MPEKEGYPLSYFVITHQAVKTATRGLSAVMSALRLAQDKAYADKKTPRPRRRTIGFSPVAATLVASGDCGWHVAIQHVVTYIDCQPAFAGERIEIR